LPAAVSRPGDDGRLGLHAASAVRPFRPIGRRETGRARAIGAAFLPGTFIAEGIGAYLLGVPWIT
jgi:hypothetical protein